MNRSEFLAVTQAIIGGIAFGNLGKSFGLGQDSVSTTGTKDTIQPDDDYLAKGLIGMVRAGGWFDAHWGAAVLAGEFLCRENPLDDETKRAIRTQLDVMIHLRRAQFAPLGDEPTDEASIEKIAAALLPAIKGGLRAHGHAVIFASLAIKALRRLPNMAQPKIIAGLCDLSRQIARQAPKKASDSSRYANSQSMIEATFDALARFEPLLGRPSIRRPNFTHITTHTEALLNLEEMGYGELALAGHEGHRAHILEPLPEFDPLRHPRIDSQVTLDELMTADFWGREANQSKWRQAWNETTNPNGYWVAFGHLFKVLYSYHRLIGRIESQEKVEVCSRILLERYWNPEVQGG